MTYSTYKPDNSQDHRLTDKGPDFSYSAALIPHDSKRESFHLKDTSTVFGRQKYASDCYLDSGHVNGVHALIDCRAGDYYLSDPGSINGTYLNGRVLPDEEEVLLRDGDEIYFADVGYTFRQNLPDKNR